MNNSRPTQSVDLPLLDGTTISCTIKTPKMKLVADLNKLRIDAQMKVEECNALYNTTGDINQRLAKQLAFANRLKSSHASDADVQAALEGANDIELERDEVIGTIDQMNEEIVDNLKAQVATIINIPNSADGTPRTADTIDWDNCDQNVLKDAVSFFLNGPTS